MILSFFRSKKNTQSGKVLTIFPGIVLLIMLLTFMFEKVASAFDNKALSQAHLMYNVPYGMHKRQVMDVFLPPKVNDSTPVVLLIHGGAWKLGNKLHVRSIQKMLVKKGIVCASMNYRLVRKGIYYTDQLDDVNRAAGKLQQMMNEWGGQQRYMVMGESAGGHLALLHGYQHPETVCGIISLSGPTDFYSETYRKSRYFQTSHSTFETIIGGSYRDTSSLEIFRKASPLSQVTQVPTLAFQGTMDPLVNVQQGLSLQKELEAKGVPHDFVLMRNAGHVPRLLPSKRNKIIYPAILSFIGKYGHPSGASR